MNHHERGIHGLNLCEQLTEHKYCLYISVPSFSYYCNPLLFLQSAAGHSVTHTVTVNLSATWDLLAWIWPLEPPRLLAHVPCSCDCHFICLLLEWDLWCLENLGSLEQRLSEAVNEVFPNHDRINDLRQLMKEAENQWEDLRQRIIM